MKKKNQLLFFAYNLYTHLCVLLCYFTGIVLDVYIIGIVVNAHVHQGIKCVRQNILWAKILQV